jgi:ATP/maltotriose-dependent transcriptional regulator MalT
MWARKLTSLSEAFEGRPESIALARAEIDGMITAGAGVFMHERLGQLADACRQMGKSRDAMDALHLAFDLVARNQECFWEAELHRVLSELKWEEGRASEAEVCAQRALHVARRQNARSLELRAATTCARIMQSHGRRSEALDLLRPIYDWFTEGRDTKDHIEARQLLDELEGRRATH